MFRAGAVADDRDGGADAAVVASRFFEHCGSDFRSGLKAIGFIGRFNKIGILIGKRSALRTAFILKFFQLVKPNRISM